jgi:phosphoserine aminotransferase
MISFYPGPSKVYPEVEIYLQDAMKEGILSQNHRSQSFIDMLKECIRLFKQKQNIPNDYQVFFTSSATECWEIISQSLVKETSHHVYNGAFGEKWFDYSSKISKKTSFTKFDFQEKFDADLLENIDSLFYPK